MAQQTDKNGKPLTYWGGKQDEILIPAIPNVECRDGKEIGIWMEGWLQGYKEAQAQYEAKETFYTKQDLIDLVQSLKDYTHESHTILGHDEREASEFVEIYLNPFKEDKTSWGQGMASDELSY
jgi:hypothetical protein